MEEVSKNLIKYNFVKVTFGNLKFLDELKKWKHFKKLGILFKKSFSNIK